jgi:hypothetical protein
VQKKKKKRGFPERNHMKKATESSKGEERYSKEIDIMKNVLGVGRHVCLSRHHHSRRRDAQKCNIATRIERSGGHPRRRPNALAYRQLQVGKDAVKT